jgi:hypothetical protein
LILSPSTGRREIFGAAAAGSGWRVLVTGDVTLAQDSLNQYVVQLGIVDLVGVEASTYRGLLERLANPAQVLLVVCGNEGNVREEIWVRQQGAWLYLTGVKDGACISAVCQEARDIIDRLRQVSDAGRPARSCK